MSEAIKEITSGENTYQVVDLPVEIQNLVKVYEVAVQNIRDAEIAFVIARAGANGISGEIAAAVAKFEQAAAESVDAAE